MTALQVAATIRYHGAGVERHTSVLGVGATRRTRALACYKAPDAIIANYTEETNNYFTGGGAFRDVPGPRGGTNF